MSEKFEFNSTVTLDGARLMPDKINVKANRQGVLEEHMGEDDVDGNDIYCLKIHGGCLMVTADSDSTVNLYSKDFEENRHLSTLTVSGSTIDGLKVRGNCLIANGGLYDCDLRESQVIFEEGTATLKHVTLSDSQLHNSQLFPGAMLINSTLKDTIVFAGEESPVHIEASELIETSLVSTGEITVTGSVMHGTILEFSEELEVGGVRWYKVNMKGEHLNVRDSFDMFEMSLPGRSLAFYRTGPENYAVSLSEGEVVELKVYADNFDETLRNEFLALGEENADSMIQYIRDTIDLRTKLLSTMKERRELAPITPLDKRHRAQEAAEGHRMKPSQHVLS